MSTKFDCIFKNGRVLDGAGNDPVNLDVGIQGGAITGLGELSDAETGRCIDIAGKMLAPGFIDVHTHDDNAVLKTPDCLPKISQGVTTVIVGNCGLSASPVRLKDKPPDPLNLLGSEADFRFNTFGEYTKAVASIQPAVNVAALVGHTSLRVNHMDDLFRTASLYEIDAMQDDLDASLAEGALGLSTGLAYATARNSTTPEVISLAGKVNRYGGIYVTHLRSEFNEILDALSEAFEIGETADLPVVVSHLKCAGPDNWGRSKEVLDFIQNSEYRDRIYMDCYPYAAGSSTLDLGQVDERVKIIITWSDPHPEMAQMTLSAIARKWETSQSEAARRLQPAGAVYFSISEDDMMRIISHPKTMIGSDGLPHDPHPHPRLWGTFPRVLGRLSREQKLFSLSTAIHKMTGLPARNFRLSNRGLIKVGYAADLVVFDADTVSDVATFDSPKQISVGIESVFVNGVESFRRGASTHKRGGIFIRSGNPAQSIT
ncbi:D-aminoacylase [Opitutaceae bacterium]|nr:D-aminoacylase [bacterium]MDB4385014.1 D-aminoacylase [Opitutaceae bacterium]